MDIIKRKGTDKCIAITDSMFTTNAPNIKQFKINGVVGKVSRNGEYIQIAGKENMHSLFGSMLTMDKAFSNLLTWFTQPIEGIWNSTHEPVDFEEALVNSSKMCSQNPAVLLGIYAPQNNYSATGSIGSNKRADIVITDIIKNKHRYDLVIDKVLLKGDVVHSNKR